MRVFLKGLPTSDFLDYFVEASSLDEICDIFDDKFYNLTTIIEMNKHDGVYSTETLGRIVASKRSES